MMRKIAPAEVERRTGLSTDVMRDWRRRGLLHAGTQGDNGRWTYTMGDVAQLAIVNALTRWRIVSDLTDAFRVADYAVPHVYARLSNDPTMRNALDFKFLTAFAVRPTERLQVEAVTDLSEVSWMSVPGFIVVDLDRLSIALSDALEGLFEVREG